MSTFECLGSVHWGESQVAKPGPQERTQPTHFLLTADSYMSLVSQPEARGQMPFMDHWNVSHPHVSLRDIIKEEQALQKNMEKVMHTSTVPVDVSILYHTKILDNIILGCCSLLPVS